MFWSSRVTIHASTIALGCRDVGGGVGDFLMSKPYRLFVVELSDICKRRDPSKPNLLVARTQMALGTRFEFLQRTRKREWFSDHIHRLRIDLSGDEEFSDASRSRDALRLLVDNLSRQGYTVNRDTRVWQVYVVELDPRDVKNPGLGYVYVGETCKAPEVRLQEHLTMKRNRRGRLFSPVVAKYGIRLRAELAPTERYFCSEASKAAEIKWAEHLRELGYVVEGGH